MVDNLRNSSTRARSRLINSSSDRLIFDFFVLLNFCLFHQQDAIMIYSAIPFLLSVACILLARDMPFVFQQVIGLSPCLDRGMNGYRIDRTL